MSIPLQRQKIYVLDTNVLLHDPLAFKKFDNNEVVIPLTVISELDNKKTASGILGANSRTVARELAQLSMQGSLERGVQINEKGGMLRLVEGQRCETELRPDERILDICLYTKLRSAGTDVILVTKDKYLQALANFSGVLCEDYRNDKVEERSYTGQTELRTDSETIEDLFSGKELQIPELCQEPINLCVKLLDAANPKHTALAIHTGNGVLKAINGECSRVLKLKALNAEQRFAIRVLTDPNIYLVSLAGATGSGKTILSLAAALDQVERKSYKQVIVARSEVPIGSSQGFLAGSIQEKTDPWLSSIYGCLDQLVGCKDDNNTGFKSSEYLIDKGILRAEALAYIRGITWSNAIVIMDEVQNTSTRELKAVLTRAGDGEVNPTKVILLGDTDQIDNPYLDSASNGLSKVINSFKGWKHYAHVSLTRTVRSELSKEAGLRL